MFFHFVGATPGSTDLAFFLQRLSKEINVSKVINVSYIFASRTDHFSDVLLFLLLSPQNPFHAAVFGVFVLNMFTSKFISHLAYFWNNVFVFQRDVVSDLDSLVQLTNSLLSNKNTRPCVVFVDAINQVKYAYNRPISIY